MKNLYKTLVMFLVAYIVVMASMAFLNMGSVFGIMLVALLVITLFMNKIALGIQKIIYVPGNKFYRINKHIDSNPFNKHDNYEVKYEVEIVNAMTNKDTSIFWVQYKYVSDERYAKHINAGEVFTDTADDFGQMFDNRTVKVVD